MSRPVLSLSIVSHGQIELVSLLLADIKMHCDAAALEVILTLNIPEQLPVTLETFPFSLTVIQNLVPQGFGRNHNQAFRRASGEFFGVINPDVRIGSNMFAPLLAGLSLPSVGVAAPLVVNHLGAIENSARHFPTPLTILCKLFGRCQGADYPIGQAPVYPDWAGGMFMLFRCDVYRQLGGFNEKYFLYYEDVDICARIWLKGLRVALIPEAKVTHEARRSSHQQAAYLLMHIRSMARFFLSVTFFKAMLLRRRR